MDIALLRWYIRQRREQAGLTQAQMADRCSTSLRNYKRIETVGLKNFPLETLAIIAAALEIGVCELLRPCESNTRPITVTDECVMQGTGGCCKTLLQRMDHTLAAFQEAVDRFRSCVSA